MLHYFQTKIILLSKPSVHLLEETSEKPKKHLSVFKPWTCDTVKLSCVSIDSIDMSVVSSAWMETDSVFKQNSEFFRMYL